MIHCLREQGEDGTMSSIVKKQLPLVEHHFPPVIYTRGVEHNFTSKKSFFSIKLLHKKLQQRYFVALGK